MANNVDLEQMLHSAEYDMGLHCLLRPIYPNTQEYIWFTQTFQFDGSPYWFLLGLPYQSGVI